MAFIWLEVAGSDLMDVWMQFDSCGSLCYPVPVLLFSMEI